MMTNDIQDRWRTSIHEAGHCIASLSLNGECSGTMLDADGGMAFTGGLYGDREAYSIACGPAAERLASEFEAPTCQTMSLDDLAANPPKEGDRTFALWCGAANIPGISRNLETDDRRLAVWAITGRESEPDAWARRIAFARHVADQIVQENAKAIVRIASALFQKGALTAPEIKQLYEGQNAN